MGRIVRVSGLPDFNGDDQSFKITTFDGWADAAAPSVSLSPNGGGAGAVASATWLPNEQYLTLTGDIKAYPEDLDYYRDQLLLAFPTNRDVPLQVLGNGNAIDKQIWVRRYDRPTLRFSSRLDFAVPLVAADPYRYALLPSSGSVGVFTGGSWYRTYGGGYRTITGQATTYQRSQPAGALLVSLQTPGYGTAISRRVVVTITGPLPTGKWWIYNESIPNRRLWCTLPIGAGRILTLDSHSRVATMQGSDVTDYIYGDWPILVPGGNVFRLAAAASATGYADITAYEAFE